MNAYWIGLLVLVVLVVVKGIPAWRRHRQKFVFQEFGYDVREFALEREGTLRYAQWLHPRDRPKSFDQDMIDACREYIREGDLVIDIGAHTGDTTLPMAVAAGKGGCVLALEPNPYVFKILEENARLNPEKTRIVPLPYAATDEDGSFTFHYGDAAFCNGGFLSTIEDQTHRHDFPLEVQGRNLVRLLRKEYGELLPRLSFVKVDTEGYDRQVIESLRDVIEEFHPVLVTEVMKKLTENERLALFDLLAGLGYRCFFRAEGPSMRGEPLVRDGLLDVRQFDILALPESA